MAGRAFLIGLVGLGLAASSAACGQEGDGGSAGPPKSGKPKVCLVMKSLANDFFQGMRDGAVAHANKRADLTLEAVGTQNETDIDGQVAAVEKCVTQRVSAIVIAPADSRALIAPLKRAMSSGVKVVNIDVKLDEDALKGAGAQVPFVGPDNREGARLAGAELAKKLGKGGKVVMLEGNPGAANAEQRAQGFKDAVAQGGLKLLDSKTAHWETDEAHTVMGNMLTAHPDVQGVLAANDSMALGVLKAIQDAHKTNAIKVASFDNIPAIQPGLKDGSVIATVDQFGSAQAAVGIDYAMRMIKGENITGWQKTQIKLITAAGQS
ncbi:sugar ABC transporter substrate-binding protein [Actinomadura graeca]|uniref:Sugar ABC transporter substrate-binding protein n=1 Tax=Actinomadura graeca TaxID=2750812 RepID=A0ABX8QT09_9ACTN|nr:sugar ABC transporter substrate-binding protein [Actinomadura graeca]QXJ21856.1 sugar ABC transporter substrate-binding protein [Actinomadura graeca]